MPSLVSIVLPTYNEAGNIVLLIEALDRDIPSPKEIIVVDDNSPDGTSERVRELIGKKFIPGLRLETRMIDRGLLKSIRRGIELAEGDIICWMDCDFSHPPETMAELVKQVQQGAGVAIASRYIHGGSYKRGLGWFGADESALAVLLSRLINWFIHIALDRRLHDYTSGFIAIRRSLLKSLPPLRGDYGEYFMELMYRVIKSENVRIVEIPFVSPPRRTGQSKTGTTFRQLFRRGIPYFLMIPRLWVIRIRHRLGRNGA
ncbi:MAG: glycosyltransferase [Patescibacteria group bacterium]